MQIWRRHSAVISVCGGDQSVGHSLMRRLVLAIPVVTLLLVGCTVTTCTCDCKIGDCTGPLTGASGCNIDTQENQEDDAKSNVGNACVGGTISNCKCSTSFCIPTSGASSASLKPIPDPISDRPQTPLAATGPTCGTVDPFTLKFTANMTFGSGDWRLSLLKDGQTVGVIDSGTAPLGGEISRTINPTGDLRNRDEDGDGFYDGVYLFECRPDRNGFYNTSIADGPNVLPVGCTWHITVGDDGIPHEEIIPASTASPSSNGLGDRVARLFKSLRAPTPASESRSPARESRSPTPR
jgi:hypothetical protein